MHAQYGPAIGDIIEGALSWHMWGRLGWLDIKRRYRRTLIGPFWTTLSLGIFILALGIMWAHLWKQDPKTYLPFLCSGFLVWVMVSTTLIEGCAVFFSAEGLIKQLRFPYTTLVCSVVWRNVIVFLHNLIIFLFVSLYAGVQFTWATLLVVPGLLLVIVNGLWMVIILGLVCSRYRDIQQVMSSILQLAMFVTPIFWTADQLGERFGAFIDYNFLFHVVDIVRSPLLGKPPALWSWIFVGAATLLGWVATLVIFSRFRRRITYWI
ncbi:MAG: ABC transporter permease [Nitrospira sp.]|nr:ABC transporter permease [Nitrospira sp.]MCA9475005.1 ABC transporter permease [Nitrospira sp.]MCB9710573.1 ABC transporter permease [Nitrospiraceae bacterium]